MNVFNLQDEQVKMLLREMLVITEQDLYHLSQEYQVMKQAVDSYTSDLARMNREAEELEKRHSTLERLLGVHCEH